jgi:hypothetical protein
MRAATINALVVADTIVIPINSSSFALLGMNQLFKKIVSTVLDISVGRAAIPCPLSWRASNVTAPVKTSCSTTTFSTNWSVEAVPISHLQAH